MHVQAVGTRLAYAGRKGRHIVCCVTFELTGCDHAVAGVVHVIMSREFKSSRSVCKSLILLNVATYGLLCRQENIWDTSPAAQSHRTRLNQYHRSAYGAAREERVGTRREHGLGRFCAHY